MELFKLLGTIVIEKGEALRALREAQQEGEKTESKLGKVFSGIGKGAAACGKAIAVGIGAGATAMAGLTMKALSASGELEQNLGGAEAVFGDLGDSIDKMSTKVITGYDKATGKAIYETRSLEKESKEAYKNMGLSQSDYLATANKMGALFKGAGFETQEALDLSSQAMQRAADVASIMGIDTESAMEAVAGAAKGNFTMMDNLGVAMNDTAIAAYAASKGIKKSTTEMSQQEKIGLAMEMFLEKTSYAAGNYAKENETLAGSLSTAKAAFTNFLAGSGDVDSLVSSFSNLANVVVNSLTEIAPRLTQGLADIIKQAVPLIPPLLNQLLPVLVDGAVSLVDGLVSAMPGIISAITSALPALIEGVLQLVTNLALALPQIIQPILTALPQIIQSIIKILPDLIPALIQGAVQLIVMLCQSLPQIIMPIIDNLPMIVTTIVSALIENLPALIMGLIQLVLGIVKAIPQIFNALYIQLPKALWKGIFDGLGKAFSGLGKWFSETFSKAKDGAVKAWSDAKEKFNKVKEKAVSGFNDLKTKVGNKFNEAKTAAQQKWADAKEKFGSVKDKVVSAFSNLGSKVSPLFSKAKENATKTWSDVKGIFEKFKNGDIVGAFSDLGSLLKGKFSGALELAKQGFNKIKQIGKDLVSGLWNGISDKFSWLTGKIKGFAKNVTDKLKGFFGIKSPSRVFRDQIGKMLAEGVAVGITDKESKAVEAAEKMAKNVLDSAQKKLDSYKVYNELTLADEVAFWDGVRQQVKEGTDARLTADQKYAEAKKSLNDEILSAEKTLQEKLDGIAQKVADRQNALVDSLSAFGELQFDEWLHTPQMIKNLNDQVTALEKYQTFMDGLRERIGGTALFEELETWGVNALPNLDTLYNMADTQLNNIVELYDKKLSIAGNIASKQLKEETIAETSAAYQEFETKCAELGVEVVEDTIEMESGIQTAFTGITQTVQTAASSIAVNIGEKIKNAIDSVTESLGRMMSAFEAFGTQMNIPNFNVGNVESLSNPATFNYDAASGEFGGYSTGSIFGNRTQGGNNQNSIVISYLQKIVEVLTAYFPQLIDAFDVDLCLDTGVLVGELAEPMNEALGRLSSRKERGL